MEHTMFAVGCGSLLTCLLLTTVWAECEDDIVTPLRDHVVPNSIWFFEGRFTDVWMSEHMAMMVNYSSTAITTNRTTISNILYNDGGQHTVTGRLIEEADGVITIKVDNFQWPGLIFPVYSSPQVLAYYNCYPNVTGKGVSVITVRNDYLLMPAVFDQVVVAEQVFKMLQDRGIPINDGINI